MVLLKPYSPLERRAEFSKAAELQRKSKTAICRQFGVTWSHVRECFLEKRLPSRELAEQVASFCGVSVPKFWGGNVAPVGTRSRRIVRALAGAEEA